MRNTRACPEACRRRVSWRPTGRLVHGRTTATAAGRENHRSARGNHHHDPSAGEGQAQGAMCRCPPKPERAATTRDLARAIADSMDCQRNHTTTGDCKCAMHTHGSRRTRRTVHCHGLEWSAPNFHGTSQSIEHYNGALHCTGHWTWMDCYCFAFPRHLCQKSKLRAAAAAHACAAECWGQTRQTGYRCFSF